MKLNLSELQVDLILTALSNVPAPWNQTNPLINLILQQANDKELQNASTDGPSGDASAQATSDGG